jgi:hypothetical protein
MRLPRPISGDTKFFRAFSRFEQVLKSSGYFKNRQPKTSADGHTIFPDAEPNWAKFETDSSIQNICDQPSLSPEIRYLMRFPPWHEVIVDGRLQYQKKQGTITTTPELLRAVRRVRNNLFHGAKTAAGPMNDPVRNAQLIRASMHVLRVILKLRPDLRAKFDAYDW